MGFGTPLYPFSSVTRGLEANIPATARAGALYSAYDEPALYFGNEINSFVDIVCRNKALDRSVAGLYACQTLLHENYPACIEEYHIHQNYAANGTTGVIAGTGTNQNLTAPARMEVTSGTVSGNNARILIPYQFPAGGNFLEACFTIHSVSMGVGNACLFAGWKNALNTFDPATADDFAGFWHETGGDSRCGIRAGGSLIQYNIKTIFGRNIQAGDTVAVRLFRIEGAIDIDSVSFYVNGKRVATMRGTALMYIPEVGLYPGFGAYANDTMTTEANLTIRGMDIRVIP